MGMFDDIRCEYPLPLPENQGELAGKDWAKQPFQTKSLGQEMSNYCIRTDGTLWREKVEYEALKEEERPWIKPREVRSRTWIPQEHFFGTVEFYDSFWGQKNDYWMEWAAVFASGKLQEIRVVTWRLKDNSERLRFEAEREAERVRTERFLTTWMGRFLYPPYAWAVGAILGRWVAGASAALSGRLGRLRAFAWRLESRLAPHGNPIGRRLANRRYERRRQQLQAETTAKERVS